MAEVVEQVLEQPEEVVDQSVLEEVVEHGEEQGAVSDIQQFDFGIRFSTQPMTLPTTFGLSMPALGPVQAYQFQSAQDSGTIAGTSLGDNMGLTNIQSMVQLGAANTTGPFVFYAEAPEASEESDEAPAEGTSVRTRDAVLKKKGPQSALARCLCS